MLLAMQALTATTLDIDTDALREFMRREIEQEIGEEVDWGDVTEFQDFITLTIDQKKASIGEEKVQLDAAPFISPEGRTLVPIRFVSEAMDNEVDWKPGTREVIINNDIVLQIDSVNAYAKGEQVILDTAPVIVNGRTMVPIRFISEVLGYEVGWNSETREVTINYCGCY